MQQKADVNTQDRSNTLLRLHVTCQSINSRQIKWYVQYAGLCTLVLNTFGDHKHYVFQRGESESMDNILYTELEVHTAISYSTAHTRSNIVGHD